MQRMRTITEAYHEIKARDENTALTLYAMKTLVRSGVIASVKIGRKQLVNMAVLSQYLDGNNPAPQAKILSYGAIRKVGSYNG